MEEERTTKAVHGASVADDGTAAAIMSEVHALYTDAERGLSILARRVGLSIHAPRRKVNVLIIGNHSAGKSSFINWYIEDHVQRTGVAIETQGFTIVTSGTRKTLAPIKGESTVMMYPYLAPLKERFGKPLIENLSTCVSTSTAREFAMVDFIDSPGLVDGDISYPFDVNDAIVRIADSADLVFVFLDPMGQALCSRTMNVVKNLNARHFDRMKYFLTKADTVHNPKELMKLMVQITQNIKEHINNQHGLEIPAIWLPRRQSPRTPGDASPSPSASPMRWPSGDHGGDVLQEDVNQIGDVCAAIAQAIHQKVQDNLSHVEQDCLAVQERTRALLAQNEREIAARQARELVAVFFSVCAWVIPIVTALTLMGEYEQHLPAVVLEAEFVMPVVQSMYGGIRPLLWEADAPLGVMSLVKFVGSSMVLFIVLNGISKFTHAQARKFQPQKREVIEQWRHHEQLTREIIHRRQELFLEYVRTFTRVEGTTSPRRDYE